MKLFKTLLVATLAAVLAVFSVAVFSACGEDKAAAYKFTGTYTPSEGSPYDPIEFVLTLYDDNSLELTPGVIVTVSGSELVIDGTATGEWSEEGGSISIRIDSADQTNGEPSYTKTYTATEKDGEYSFLLFPSLMGYTSRSVSMSTKASSEVDEGDKEDETEEGDGQEETPVVAKFVYSNSTGSMNGEIALREGGNVTVSYSMNFGGTAVVLYSPQGTWTESEGVYTVTIPADSNNSEAELVSVTADGTTKIVWSFRYSTSQGVQTATDVEFVLETSEA